MFSGSNYSHFAPAHPSRTDECDILNTLLNAGDQWVLAAYRSFCVHRDTQQLKDDLQSCARERKPAANAAKEAGVEDYMARLQAFVEHLYRIGKIEDQQAHVLAQLIDNGSAAVIAAYLSAREKRDPEGLVVALREISNFYLRSEEQPEENNLPPRPAAPTPYSNENMTIVDELLRSGQLPAMYAQKFRWLATSDHPFVQAAFEAYQADGDAEELVDTLIRVISHMDQAGGKAAVEGVAAGQGFMHLSSTLEGARGLVTKLYEAGTLEMQQYQIISSLLDQDGSTQQQVLAAAYDIFTQDNDAVEFHDTLVRVVEQVKQTVEEHTHAFSELLATSAGFSAEARALLMEM